MIIAGIDPGLSGAVAFIDTNEKSIEYFVTPTVGKDIDVNEFYNTLKRVNVDHYFLEKVWPRPGNAASATFKFGRVFGITEALIYMTCKPFTMVSPQKWTKVMHSGVDGKDAKEKSLKAVKRLFPNEDLRKNERCRIFHDGFVDALLIAEYGRRIMGS